MKKITLKELLKQLRQELNNPEKYITYNVEKYTGNELEKIFTNGNYVYIHCINDIFTLKNIEKYYTIKQVKNLIQVSINDNEICTFLILSKWK